MEKGKHAHYGRRIRISTFASAAGLTFPAAKNDPPSMTIFFTFLAKDESLLIAC